MRSGSQGRSIRGDTASRGGGRGAWRACPFAALLGLALGLGMIVPATAIEDVDLFRAEVPAPDRGDATRAQALQSALAKVLVRLTGDPGVASRPAAREILSRPQTYLQQYRYVERAGAGGPYLLEARFDPQSLQAAVSAAGLPVWSSHRPSVLVWLAVDGGKGRSLVGEDDRSGVRATVYSVAEERGMPVVLPLLDLEDRRQVTASDILAGFDDVARHAAVRYATDAVLTAGAKGYRDGSWRVSWHLYSGSQTREWVTEGRTLKGAVAAGMQRLADEMARGLAARSGGGVETRSCCGSKGSVTSPPWLGFSTISRGSVAWNGCFRRRSRPMRSPLP